MLSLAIGNADLIFINQCVRRRRLLYAGNHHLNKNKIEVDRACVAPFAACTQRIRSYISLPLSLATVLQLFLCTRLDRGLDTHCNNKHIFCTDFGVTLKLCFV